MQTTDSLGRSIEDTPALNETVLKLIRAVEIALDLSLEEPDPNMAQRYVEAARRALSDLINSDYRPVE